MKTLLIGIAAAGLVGVTGVSAHDQKDKTAEDTSSSSTKKAASDSSMSQTPSSSSSATQSPSSSSTATQSPSNSAGTSASASNELSGTVKKVDKDKQSLKISSTTGGEQELKVGSSATITRDGSQATLDQIKEGDQVRASLNASGDQASKIEVQSKAKSHDKSPMKSESKEKK